MIEKSEATANPKKENMFLNLGFNLILPIIVLRKGDEWLGDPLSKALSTSPESALVGSIVFIIGHYFSHILRNS